MATIKFSEFNAGNINVAGAQLVGLTGGNSATNVRFTASDLVNGLATITYVDSQDAGLQSQITQNTNDVLVLQGNVISLENDVANIVDLDEQTLSWDGPAGNLAISKGNFVILQEVLDNGSNIATLQGQVSVLQGNVVSIEAELANINTDSQTLTYDGANANLSISNGNSVVLQEVLDNAGNITVIQGQISDLQANGNIQTLSLDNSSNVLSISAGNTVDFTTVLGNAGSEDTDVFGTTISIANTSTDVYNRNGPLPADPQGMGVADPNGKSGWYWSSPGPTTPAGLNSFQWKMFNNDGPQTFTVADIDYIYMIVDLYTVGQVYFNVYTGTGPVATTFTSRFSFTLNGDFANTGRFLMWAKPPGSTTIVDDVEVYPFLERLELPYDALASSGPLLTSEPIKSVNVQTRSNPALTAGEVEFNLKSVGYKVNDNYIQNFDMEIYGGDQSISLDDSSNVLTISGNAGNNTVDFTTVLGNVAGGGGGGNPFDQNLNTTDSPTFDNLSTTGELDVNGSGTHTFEGTIQFTQLTNFGGTVGITSILDEDDMVSDSATALATQQSIKAYVDANAGGGGIAAVVDDTSPELGGTLNSNGFNIEMSSASPVEFGIEWNDGSGTKYGDIMAQPDANEFEISSGSGARDLVLVGDRDIEIKTGLLGRDIIIGDLTWPASDGSAGQAIVTDGSGTLSFTTTFSLDSLDVSNANITTNASTNSLDIQFDSRPVAKITSGVMVQVHGSWDASAGAAFSWATDEIASHGISNVTRDSAGIFTVTFETPFASDAYTATFGVGSTDYSGSGASPREVSLLSRTANSCQVICERSDDAVNEDNFYMSLMICGVI